jgi:hypothetical protein
VGAEDFGGQRRRSNGLRGWAGNKRRDWNLNLGVKGGQQKAWWVERKGRGGDAERLLLTW